jgi:outer membrane receptor protein involved in Fe transport
VPEWAGNVGLVYATDLSSQYGATGRLDVSYQSGRSSLLAPQNPAYFVAGGYVLTNLHFNLKLHDGWSVSLDVDNAFNRFAVLSIQADDSNLVETQTPARPRTVRPGAYEAVLEWPDGLVRLNARVFGSARLLLGRCDC